jgi:acetyl-CoA C-acetyltransferase
MEKAVIIDAIRTPIGSFAGSLSSLSADKLGTMIIRSLIERNSLDAESISEIIMGQVLTGGTGQNPARQASVNAGIPFTTPALTINQVCGSGLRSIAMGMQSIIAGDASILIAGGQESMSQSMHALYMRNGLKMGDAKLVDMMIKDGLTDAFNNYHMGITAENVAKKFGISREQQDQLAYRSQRKATEAMQAGRFKDEILKVTIENKKGELVVEHDEFIRPDTTLEGLAKLKPAFISDGTVTAGNASGINDGAAGVLMASESYAIKQGLKPLARVVAWAHAGVDPQIMGIGPVFAVRKVLAKAGWQLSDVELIEANEAFAAQALAVSKELDFDMNKVNVNGGAIAIGHPIGASGTRIVVSLLHEMKKRNASKGLATLCIGGGMGIALCLEKY